ncbi:MAG: COX15/CtaA family protein, partial [Hyphomicrobiales bacterium]|nr:COX15/CtaA family protein [Hyphomicrobiales bacterium]
MVAMSRTQSVGSVRPRAEDARAVRTWLWTMAGLVFAMVLVGGATRLTESGLSITEWKPVEGALPPLSDAQWADAFAKYRAIPQYAAMNAGMTLAQYKFIFLWEWSHRLLARLVGLAFLAPLAYFALVRALPRGLGPRLALATGLLALEPVVGWWMVASGLETRVEVSQYRLATHLTIAAGILAAFVFAALKTLPARELPAKGAARGARVLLGLVLLQIAAGALVAGLRAGKIYETWPLMEGGLAP